VLLPALVPLVSSSCFDWNYTVLGNLHAVGFCVIKTHQHWLHYTSVPANHDVHVFASGRVCHKPPSAAPGSAVHSDKQSISSTAAGAATAAAVAARKGLLSPHVTAAVLPAHGSTFDEAALAAYSTAQRLAAFSSSLILMMPPAPDAASQSSFKKHLDDAQLPPQLQHDIVWTGDASAARNAAADVAHANGAAWLFVAVAGDAVTVQDGGLVLQQLQESCESEQLLACHSSLQDPWAQVGASS
jgi:hypothetical protein